MGTLSGLAIALAIHSVDHSLTGSLSPSQFVQLISFNHSLSIRLIAPTEKCANMDGVDYNGVDR